MRLRVVIVADSEDLVSVANDELHHLLHQVDQEEAGAEDEVRQELYPELLPGLGELLTDLGEDVEHGGGHEDSATEAEEERGDQSVSPTWLSSEAEKFATEDIYLDMENVAKNGEKLRIDCLPNWDRWKTNEERDNCQNEKNNNFCFENIHLYFFTGQIIFYCRKILNLNTQLIRRLQTGAITQISQDIQLAIFLWLLGKYEKYNESPRSAQLSWILQDEKFMA